MTFALPFSKLFGFIRSLLQPADTMMLVGGVVRDLMLNREISDIDIVLQLPETKIKPIARKIANQFHGAMYSLDDERLTFRILAKDAVGHPWTIDLAIQRGQTLAEDLALRDFTINAMALDITVAGRQVLIDPFHGVSDLNTGLLRPVSDTSLTDDPIRVLRSIRFLLEFGFKTATNFESFMQAAVPGLAQVSGERFRDELFRLLARPFACEGIHRISELGALNIVSPYLGFTWDAHIEKTLSILDHLTTILEKGLDEKQFSLPFMIDIEQPVFDYLAGPISSGRSRLALLKFACMLGAVDAMFTGVSYFAFSQHEQNFLKTLVKHITIFKRGLASVSGNPRKNTYRFYKATGMAGPAICILGGCKLLAEGDGVERRWYEQIRQLLASYFYRYEVEISPAPLLDGNAVMTAFGLQPGRQIGILLQMLEEAQAAGEVSTTDEAIAFLAKQVALGEDEW
ncbi:MAG: CCA tRNA nucleotidyltransferase [Anaerolineae bacterium]|nr:CCA tRNA nucleotidyltransferase [Anaerolineae bacterium]